jgi:hypothetical protein
MVGRLIRLPFEAQTDHSVINAFEVLRGIYARKSYTLPDHVAIRLGRAWREAIDSYDRYKALLAFECATLFALRVALRNGAALISVQCVQERGHRLIDACDALPKMREGPSKSACRSRLQTATSCVG